MKMRKWKACLILALTGLMLCFQAFPVMAETVYQSGTTPYQADIDDMADLLTAEEEKKLADVMSPLTAYGDIAFVSIDSNPGTTESYARQYYSQHYGSSSGSILLVDMDNRYLYIFSRGFNYSVITTSRAETITDNIYRMASGGDYYACGEEAFKEMQTILEGGKIAQPMKYISNALLALIISLLIFFVIVNRTARIRRAALKELLAKAEVDVAMEAPSVSFINQTRVYSPPSDSGGSSGGGGGSSGGGGGGGGGGGHSF